MNITEHYIKTRDYYACSISHDQIPDSNKKSSKEVGIMFENKFDLQPENVFWTENGWEIRYYKETVK